MRLAPVHHLVSVVVCGAILSCCGSSLPPILRDASGSGGWLGGCAQPAALSPIRLALSPELNERLSAKFPSGTSEKSLTDELLKNDFVLAGEACPEDATIHWATYDEPPHWFGFPTHASVYWKTNQEGQLVWTEGFVVHEGL